MVLLHPDDVSDAELAGHLVALLFAAAGPLSPEDAARLLEIPPERLEQVCDALDNDPPVGLVLQRCADRLRGSHTDKQGGFAFARSQPFPDLMVAKLAARGER